MTNLQLPQEPLLGFIGASASSCVLWLSEIVSTNLPVSNGFVELGGSLGLVGFLSYGCVALWKQLQCEKRESVKERDRHYSELSALHSEILGETRRQNQELITVLKKLDPDGR